MRRARRPSARSTPLGGEIELSRLRLRESAGRYFADVVVSVPPGRPVAEGHDAADRVEQAVERALPGSDVVVHVEPRRSGLDLRDRVLAIALSEPQVKEAHDITVFERTDRASVSLHLKFPDELDLARAHEIAERVEAAIRERPGVEDVQTHLEPLERPLQALPRGSPAADDAVRGGSELVRRQTGREAERVRLIATDAGPVLFLTLAATRRGVAGRRAPARERARGRAARPRRRPRRCRDPHRARRRVEHRRRPRRGRMRRGWHLCSWTPLGERDTSD